LTVNGGIFAPTGRAIQAASADDVRVLVVGNPCNTNCLIAMSNAPDVDRNRWYAMTRLDQNRAVSQLAARSGAAVTEINNVTIWGNHSATQYPDFYNATIGGRGVLEVIGDESWLQGEFIKTVQQRGGAVIKARGASSAASAANAIIDSVKSIATPTAAGSSFSAAVCSDGSYGVEQGLISSFPLASDGTSWSVVGGLQHNEFGAEKLAATVAELKSERDMVRDLLAS